MFNQKTNFGKHYKVDLQFKQMPPDIPSAISGYAPEDIHKSG